MTQKKLSLYLEGEEICGKKLPLFLYTSFFSAILDTTWQKMIQLLHLFEHNFHRFKKNLNFYSYLFDFIFYQRQLVDQNPPKKCDYISERDRFLTSIQIKARSFCFSENILQRVKGHP